MILTPSGASPSWDGLGGSVFFDSGAVTAEVKDLAPRELKSAVGGGLLLSTPVGPIRFDAGWPLDSAPGQDRKLRYYLTVGTPSDAAPLLALVVAWALVGAPSSWPQGGS